MSKPMPVDGRCLCGGVRFTATFDTDANVGVCHCKLCRKWGGGPLMEVECGDSVVFENWQNIAVFRSSNRAERGFCMKCGSHLFVRSLAEGHYGIPPGLLSDVPKLELKRQVFFDKKPKYYEFDNDTRNISSDYIYRHYPECRED